LGFPNTLRLASAPPQTYARLPTIREIDPGALKRTTKFACGVFPSSQQPIGRFQPLNGRHGNACHRCQLFLGPAQ
jgi:hypothetical protein